MIEKYFVQGMVTYQGDLAMMFTASGISIGIWAVVILALFAGLAAPLWRRLRGNTADERIEIPEDIKEEVKK